MLTVAVKELAQVMEMAPELEAVQALVPLLVLALVWGLRRGQESCLV